MTNEEARAVCTRFGSTLNQYKMGSVAALTLPSGEFLVISLGTSTAKVFTKRLLTGWLFPKVLGNRRLTDWIPEFNGLSPIEKQAARAMVLDGLVSLTSRVKTGTELSLAWIAIRNPVEVAVTECGWGTTPVQR